MSDAVDRFVQAAGTAGVTVSPQHYPEGTRTAADAADAIGVEVARIVKSLVFVADDDEPVLVLTSGANRVDTDRVAAVLGASQIRKATADEAREATGFAIGGTPPFGHTRTLRSVLDRDLLAFDEVYAAAGSADTNFAIAPATLQRTTAAITAEVAER